MKLSISSQAARAAALVAVTARLFLGLVVDAPTTQNGAWLSVLIGGALAAPLVFFLSRMNDRRVLPAVTLGALALLDGASVLAALSRSAGYLALDRSPALILTLPVSLAALWCLWRGGNAVGYAAMIWVRLAALLLLVTVLLQARCYHPRWLCPVLGEGWRAILDGGVKSAGWIVAASSVLALPREDGEVKSPLPGLCASLAVSAILMLLQGMLVPTQLRGGWLDRLDALLCNGRAPLYLQLPMIALWFGALLNLLVCELLAAAGLLRALFPRMNGKLCALIVVAASTLLSGSGALAAWADALSIGGFAAVGLAMIASLAIEGGVR